MKPEEFATLRQFGTWATEHHPNPTVREAAEKGYDIRGQVFADVVARVMIATAHLSYSAELFVEGDADHQGLRYEMRENPRAGSLKIREDVAAIVPHVERPPTLEVQVMPLQRVTFWADTPKQFHKTAVVVRFVAPGLGERVLVIPTE